MSEELTTYTLHLTPLEKDTLIAALLILGNYPDYPRPEELTSLMNKVGDAVLGAEALS